MIEWGGYAKVFKCHGDAQSVLLEEPERASHATRLRHRPRSVGMPGGDIARPAAATARGWPNNTRRATHQETVECGHPSGAEFCSYW